MVFLQTVEKSEPDYPALLAAIPDPPEKLFVAGNLPAEGEHIIAIVGSRRVTGYGRQACEFLTRELCRAGFGIVSGMAFGIDAVAHEAAINQGGKTYAVLASGADIPSPASHTALYKKIIEQGGGIISEYAPGTPATQFRFPQRNRIIAGMTLGTLVIEAKEKSGALITARLALEYNREVFAVPGSIFSETSKGPNALIASGAKLVTEINDILREFNIEAIGVQQRLFDAAALTEEERAIIGALKDAHHTVDALVAAVGMPPARVHSVLTMLEIKNMVTHYGAEGYGLTR
ncbi:MAG: DNA-processing protein DprA [bacterium]|nr:DNA-processing protein DprA [bacterium]